MKTPLKVLAAAVLALALLFVGPIAIAPARGWRSG
jgi:hypothetical protein